MGYRSDLEAAQARADAATRELAEVREATEHDAARIAALERQLGDALTKLAALRESAIDETPIAKLHREPHATQAPELTVPDTKQQMTVYVVTIALAVLVVSSMLICSTGGQNESDFQTGSPPGSVQP